MEDKHLDKYLERVERVNAKHGKGIKDIHASNNGSSLDNHYFKNMEKIQTKYSQKAVKSGVKKALLIGINYINTRYALNGCINDIQNVQSLLQQKGYSIISLTDYTTSKPTYNNILQTLKVFCMNSKAGDTLYFHFSGHGGQLPDRNNDEIDKLDECIYSMELLPISDDILKQTIQMNLPRNVNFISVFDSCHSGSVLDLPYNYLDSLNYNQLTKNPKVPVLPLNVFMMSGCMDKQTSVDAYINKTSQGAMTWAFLQVVTANSTLSWYALLTKMRDLLRSSGFIQIPQMSSAQLIDVNSSFSF
jgi:hypothetical protein